MRGINSSPIAEIIERAGGINVVDLGGEQRPGGKGRTGPK
jgi:hypothetical protein